VIPSPAVIRTAIRVVRIVPIGVVRGVAAVAGVVAGVAMSKERQAVLQSMRYLAPDATERQRRRMARRLFRNMALASVDLFRLPSASLDELRGLIECVGLENLENAHATGRGVMVVSSHLGPYELAAAYLAALGFPVHGLVENLPEEVMNALSSFRAATGMKLIPIRGGLPATHAVLESGEIVLLLGDRAVGASKGGVEVSFGTGVRAIPMGTARISIQTGALVVVASIRRNPGGNRRPRYLLTFEPAIEPGAAGENGRVDLTKRIGERLAAMVERNPDEWYVFQPRWATPASGARHARVNATSDDGTQEAST
jgi:KDO2-lipid IV(A) lauroyltransferase